MSGASKNRERDLPGFDAVAYLMLGLGCKRCGLGAGALGMVPARDPGVDGSGSLTMRYTKGAR